MLGPARDVGGCYTCSAQEYEEGLARIIIMIERDHGGGPGLGAGGKGLLSGRLAIERIKGKKG